MFFDFCELRDCLARVGQHRAFITVAQAFAGEYDAEGATAIVRCDVERNPEHAAQVANMLRDMQIRASFYFHTRKECYDTSVLNEIRDAGHEIGYHHECLDRCAGDFESARQLFLREVQRFGQDGFALRTVCSHGESGLPKHGYKKNWELFERYPELLQQAGGWRKFIRWFCLI